jgi:hypothetical protein
MKRSEMIKAMAEACEEFNVPYSIDCEAMCSIILNIVEKNGMLPPKIRNPKLPKDMCRFALATERAKADAYGYSNEYTYMEYSVNAWEPEDGE